MALQALSSEPDIGDVDVTMLGEADNHRAAAGVVVTQLTAAKQCAPRRLAGAALTACRQADRHGHRAARLGAGGAQHRFVCGLFAAAAIMFVLVGVLVTVLDAGIRGTAGFGTAAGLKTTRWICGAPGIDGAPGIGSAQRLRCGTGGVGMTPQMAEAGVGNRRQTSQGTDKGEGETAQQT